jgi:hypothetical protein
MILTRKSEPLIAADVYGNLQTLDPLIVNPTMMIKTTNTMLRGFVIAAHLVLIVVSIEPPGNLY